MPYPPNLEWQMDPWGVEILLHEGVEVGKAWVSVSGDAAWRANNADLGIPDSGNQTASDLQNAKASCKFWIIRKGSLPPGQGPRSPRWPGR